MKKILLLSILGFLGFSQLGKAQTAPEVQTPMFTKVTATWCPNCGTWGWTFYKNVFEDNASDAIFIKAHYSGDLMTSNSVELKNNLFSGFQPQFFVNNTDVGANSSNISAKRTQVKSDIEQMIAEGPLVNTGLEVTRDGDTYTIKTATEFFQEGNGKYHLGILVLEDAVTNNQASLGVVDHEDVVRGAVGSTFGDMIAEGVVAEGTIINNTYTMDVDPNWTLSNISFVAVIWDEDGGGYDYVNANEAKATVVSGLNELKASTSLEWRSGAQSIAVLNVEQTISDATLEIRSINGQLIQTIFTGNIIEGQHQYNLEGNLPSGNYILRLRAKSGENSILFQN